MRIGEQEFKQVELNDERLKRRLLTLARDFYNRPQANANIPEACQSRAKTGAAYRFFDHPKITMDQLLKSHYQATVKRIGEEEIVLVVQDTTSVNYSAHPVADREADIYELFFWRSTIPAKCRCWCVPNMIGSWLTVRVGCGSTWPNGL